MSTQLNAINTLSGILSIDVIGVYDENFRQVFRNARPIKISIRPEASLPQHPLETGASFGDHIIFKPKEAELSVLIKTTADLENTYSTITQYYNNATKLNIKTKAAVFSNMIINSYPHEENAEFYDSLVLVLKLQEVLVVNSSNIIAPRNPNKVPTVDKGVVNSMPATPVQQGKAKATYLHPKIFG